MRQERDLFRHALAALAYRANRAIENAPEAFADFSDAGKSPLRILAHMGDLIEWMVRFAQGERRWQNSTPSSWIEERGRFFEALKALDAILAGPDEINVDLHRLLQGPVADALTHVGQLAMLRLAGAQIRGESFYDAEIVTGRVGADQAAPVTPFK